MLDNFFSGIRCYEETSTLNPSTISTGFFTIICQITDALTNILAS